MREFKDLAFGLLCCVLILNVVYFDLALGGLQGSWTK